MQSEEALARREADTDMEIFHVAVDHFRHDLQTFWTTTNVFLVAQGALFTLFAAVVGPRSADSVLGLIGARGEALIVAFLGLGIALLWALTAAVRLRNLRYWRGRVEALDEIVDRHRVYAGAAPRTDKWWGSSTALITVVAAPAVAIAWLVAIVTLLVSA